MTTDFAPDPQTPEPHDGIGHATAWFDRFVARAWRTRTREGRWWIPPQSGASSSEAAPSLGREES
jgi:hypothetical protein